MAIDYVDGSVKDMQAIVKSSRELIENYDEIAELCRTSSKPVFLTRDGKNDMVIMDIETYDQREDDLALGESILQAEIELRSGAGLTLDELAASMRNAIEEGVKSRG